MLSSKKTHIERTTHLYVNFIEFLEPYYNTICIKRIIGILSKGLCWPNCAAKRHSHYIWRLTHVYTLRELKHLNRNT